MRAGRTVRNATLVAALAVAALALARGAAASTPEAQLAERYAPVLELPTDVYGCESGAPFVPVNVNVLLPNEEIVLRGPWNSVNVVKFAPTVHDLTPARVDFHLDFPGNALNPGCTYVDWQKRLDAKGKPTTYAHVATDRAYPGQLALQFWFFYVFNDFNNKHEGDWEMIQLDFDAPTAKAALSTPPTLIGYSQHEGGERAEWNDSKLHKMDGTHPVVYPAAGSHANFYSAALFLGRSAAQGVGCDDTSGPHEQVRPAVADVPESAHAYVSKYPWLAFQGRWGELQPAFYNGPTGPNLKLQWTEPITWSKGWRSQSFTVPGGGVGARRATDFFCGAVAVGSNVLTRLVRHPLPGILTLAALVLLLAFAATRTTWHGSAPLRLSRRRSWGELITIAWLMYRSRFRLFAGIGLLFIPVGIIVGVVQYVLFHVVAFLPLVETAGESNVSVAGLALSFGLLFTIVALSVVQAATASALAAIDRGESASARGAYRSTVPRMLPLFGYVVLASVLVALLELTVVGIPIAIWLTVSWSLLAQVMVLDGTPSPGPLRRSAALVRGNWWRTAIFTLVITVGGLSLGPLVGGLLLLGTSAAFNVINVVAGLVYAVTMPFVAIATTYLYFDLSTRSQLAARTPRVLELPAEV
ncbi:MAG TPA: hypothetical protein VGH82_09175 [Gaiellaceae bacterium]|jgi:hypothetical protein